MKNTRLLASVFFISVFQFQLGYSQEQKNSHTFKLEEITQITTATGGQKVEYAPNSTDHLIISDFKTDGLITSKIECLFKGKKFDINKKYNYIATSELISDGHQTEYREDGSKLNERIFKHGILLQETSFYPDGKKMTEFAYSGKSLNGAYNKWFPNGQLSYSGSFKNNLKNGEFGMFDESGALIRKGVYQEGKLISGEAVVEDVYYENPDSTAQCIGGTNTFNKYLMMRAAGIDVLKNLTAEKEISFNLTVNKEGKISQVEPCTNLSPEELNLLGILFKRPPVFIPATVEQVPVHSILKVNLILAKDSIYVNEKKESPEDKIWTLADEMPEFPGGGIALRHYLASNVEYPTDAQERKIQGKVFVSFVIDENGRAINLKLERGVYSSLDREALRVVRTMPVWKPGREKGKVVKVSYTVPINFVLQ